MKHAKYQQLVEGQSSIAQKVLSVVPFIEEWDSRQIRAELFRVTSSAPDLRVVEGCLSKLVEAGLVKRLARELFRRTPVPAKPVGIPVMATPPAKCQPAPILETTMVREKPPIDSSLDKLANAAAALRGLAYQFNKIAGDIEDAALLAQQQIQDERKKSERFHQLKRLLAEEGE